MSLAKIPLSNNSTNSLYVFRCSGVQANLCQVGGSRWNLAGRERCRCSHWSEEADGEGTRHYHRVQRVGTQHTASFAGTLTTLIQITHTLRWKWAKTRSLHLYYLSVSGRLYLVCLVYISSILLFKLKWRRT